VTSDVLVIGGGATGQLAAAYLRMRFPNNWKAKGQGSSFNIAPDESKFRAYPWTAATWTAASSKKQVSEITQATRRRRPGFGRN